NPNYEPAHRELGAALGFKGDANAQVDEEHKAIQLRGDDPDAYYYLGMAYIQLSKTPEAVAAYEKCVSLDPKNAEAFHILAACLASENQFDKALQAAQKAVDLDGSNADYRTTLKKLQAKKKSM